MALLYENLSYKLRGIFFKIYIVEVKAVDILHTTFEKQTLSYLKATGLKLAFLVNFGNSRLEIRRFVNEKPRIREINQRSQANK